MNDKAAAAEVLRTAKNVLIFGHVNPDGDAIGSMLGLMWALRQRGATAHVSMSDSVPQSLRFLPGTAEVEERRPTDEDLLVILDNSDPDRIGDVCPAEVLPSYRTLNIDHHVTNERFATVNWVDARFPAVAQMILQLLPSLDVRLDDAIATCLLTGFVTDTNAFSTPHTTPELLCDAGELMRAGASLTDIIRQAYTARSLNEVRLWAEILQSLSYDDGVVWTVSTPEMRARAHAGENDGGGISTFLLTIREASVGAMFTLLDDGRVKVSLRAEPHYDVAAVAAELGGGGHPAAAGVTLDTSLEEAIKAVVPALRRLVTRNEPPTE